MSAYMYQYLREMAYGVYYERAFGKEETERLRKQLFDEYYEKYLEENMHLCHANSKKAAIE